MDYERRQILPNGKFVDVPQDVSEEAIDDALTGQPGHNGDAGCRRSCWMPIQSGFLAMRQNSGEHRDHK
jgi:hypothetical protein